MADKPKFIPEEFRNFTPFHRSLSIRATDVGSLVKSIPPGDREAVEHELPISAERLQELHDVASTNQIPITYTENGRSIGIYGGGRSLPDGEIIFEAIPLDQLTIHKSTGEPRTNGNYTFDRNVGELQLEVTKQHFLRPGVKWEVED